MSKRAAFPLLLLTVVLCAQDGVRRLYERARLLEESNKNLPEALRLFAEVVKLGKEQRSLAARAQFEQGVLLERLGRKGDAIRAFRSVVVDFPEESELVRLARAHIPTAASTRGITARQLFEDDLTSFATPSPDGRYLAVTDWSTGDLAVRDVLTGELRRVTAKRKTFEESQVQAAGALFSPQGRRLAYVWTDYRSPLELRIINLDGSGDRLLLSKSDVFSASIMDWSPDESRLIVRLQRKDGSAELVIVSTANGASIPLRLGRERGLRTALFSKDGNSIVYDATPEEAEGDKADIYAAPLAGGIETGIIENPADDTIIGWAPDGSTLVFASDRTGVPSIWAVRVVNGKAQGEPELLKSDMGRIAPLRITRNGTLFYTVLTPLFDVYTAALDLSGLTISAPKPITLRFAGHNQYPNWSRDGAYLSWTSGRGTSKPLILVQNVKTGQVREVTPKLTRYSGPQWHPTNGHIVMHATGDAGGGFYGVDPATGDASLLIQDEVAESTLEGVWSGDGKTLFNRFGDWHRGLYRLDTASGRKQVLFVPPDGSQLLLENLALSPDDSTLAFTLDEYPRKGQISLMLIPSSGGDARVLLSIVKPDRFAFGALAWTPDSREIIMARSSGIYVVSVSGGQPRRINAQVREAKMLRLSPDGKTLAFTAGEVKAHVWAMDNFLPNGNRSRQGR
jgi:Tol biopolymer transport system component